MRISDWSSDVCSSDLKAVNARDRHLLLIQACNDQPGKIAALADKDHDVAGAKRAPLALEHQAAVQPFADLRRQPGSMFANGIRQPILLPLILRSEEHTSELQSLMRISYAVFCLKKKQNTKNHHKVTR